MSSSGGLTVSPGERITILKAASCEVGAILPASQPAVSCSAHLTRAHTEQEVSVRRRVGRREVGSPHLSQRGESNV